MISCKITELKHFMTRLLASDCFDSFLLEQAIITTYNTFTIDGHLEREFYTSEEWEDPSLCPYDLSCWADIRPICFSLIKGKKTPVNMKFILYLKPEITEKLLKTSEAPIPDHFVKAFVLTIRYTSGSMTCTTGVSFTDFLPDKTPERLWDKCFMQFLEQKGIIFETEASCV